MREKHNQEREDMAKNFTNSRMIMACVYAICLFSAGSTLQGKDLKKSAVKPKEEKKKVVAKKTNKGSKSKKLKQLPKEPTVKKAVVPVLPKHVTVAEAKAIKLRKEALKAADKLIASANQSLVALKFEKAQQDLSKASKVLSACAGAEVDQRNTEIARLNEKVLRVWSNYLLKQGKIAFEQENYKEAIDSAKRAANIYPGNKKKADALEKRCVRYKESKEYREKTALTTIDTENKKRKEDINYLFKSAQVFYKNNKYGKARDYIERILIKDPYNVKAIHFLGKVYTRLNEVGKFRRENEVLERIGEIQWKWNQGVLPTDAINLAKNGPTVSDTSRTNLFEKLKTIIVPNIDLTDAQVTAVVAKLKEISKQADPEGIGINFILNIKSQDIAKVPTVTMSFSNIPMNELIRYLCQASGLKYRVEDKAVILGQEDIDDMDTRYLQVRADLISGILQNGDGGEEGAAAGDDDDDDDGNLLDPEKTLEDAANGGSSAKSVTSTALQKFFSQRGIPFPEGSTIAYDRRAGRLIVKNTPENLRKLETLLREIDITTPMVSIEAKVLEISNTDLDELGFDWVFQDTSGTTTVAPTEKILRSISGTDNHSSTGADYSIISDLAFVPKSSYSNAGYAGKYSLNVTVNAVARSGRGEILSSPKVLTMSGQEAVIRMVREEYYPKSWTEPEFEMTDNSFSYTPTYPEFGEPTDVGIRFTVTPTVSPNNYTISLHLKPEVVRRTSWTLYTYSISIPDAASGNPLTIDGTMKMPEISRRDVDTNLKVYDGETVVLGGMLQETSIKREDKIVGLGELPMVGRLFQSRMDSAEKRNLMIFVTARLMNNDGVPVRPDALRGVPEFNR